MRQSKEASTIPLLYTLLSTAVLLASAFIITSYVAYKKIFFHIPYEKDPYNSLDSDGIAPYRDNCKSLLDRVCAMPCEDVYTTSRDGLELHGILFASQKENAPFVIQFHGYKSTPKRDFAGIGVMSVDDGYNVIMPDHRAHGKSKGYSITFGVKESEDCICWIDYVIKNYGVDRKIVLQGISMGAATVILASSHRDLPSNVVGIMADCPYSSAEKIIKKVMKDMRLPLWIFYPAARVGAAIFGRFNLSSASVVKAAENSKAPILLIHGGGDDFVPFAMSEEISANSHFVELHSFEGAGHGLSYLSNEERYKALCRSFLAKLFS